MNATATAEKTAEASRPLHTPGVLAWLRMARIVGRTNRLAAERLRQRGLSHAQFDVVAQVGAAPGATQQELAECLLVTQGNVCQLLDGLEKKGLVERQREGRSNRIYLTGQGSQLFDEVVPEHERWVADRMGALSEGEQRELLRLLRKLDRSGN